MIEAILVEGLIHAVLDVGLDQALDQKPQATIDLTPITAALEELSRQNRDIFSAVSRPTQTAGEEMYERAATAFSQGWYNDALDDASKSIDLYPYSGKPRLVGGLAALALGKGDKGLELLRSAVKYSANGQPEVGAVAALVAQCHGLQRDQRL
jgi:tetratricopeptide (TPR) repeat protein